MTQAFLNEPTIEEARERYLKRWHLSSVKEAWNGKKPTLAQFKKRFGADYARRQAWLAKQNGGAGALAVAHSDDQRQEVVENALVDILERIKTGQVPEVENLGSADEDEPVSGILAILNKHRAPVAEAKTEVADTTEQPKFVKPENFNELPRSGQVYFFLHRAQEAGYDYAIVPLKRGVAAEAISQIKDDGRSYQSVASDLISA